MLHDIPALKEMHRFNGDISSDPVYVWLDRWFLLRQLPLGAALDWYGLEPGQLLLLVDDMDLPLGRLRLRASGGAGGHNGLRSTIAHLGGQDFARLRIGIGAPSANPVERKERTISHVLGRFQAAEQPILAEVLAEVISGIDLIQRFGLERAANRLNSFVAPSAAKLVGAGAPANPQASSSASSPAPSRPSP
jgi:hypothetical protein